MSIDVKKVDPLILYFDETYPINENITIKQPGIFDIKDYGENQFYSMLYVFIQNTTSKRLELWKNGIDWNKVSDYELFCGIITSIPVEMTSILFGDLDFSKFELMRVELSQEQLDELVPPLKEEDKPTKSQKRQYRFSVFEACYTLINMEQEVEIDGKTYHKMANVLREMFQIFPKTEYAYGKTTKELIMDEEEMKYKQLLNNDSNKSSSTLLPLISACVNHPGFKYKPHELKDVKIYQFMDSVKRLQVYESTHALLGGMYSGFCDTSSIPKDKFDFMRSIDN